MSIKQNEIIPLADLLLESFERDQAEFEAENNLYTTTFLNDFKLEIEAVRKLEKSRVLTTDQKTITKELKETAEKLYKPLKVFIIAVEKANLPTKIVQETITSLKKTDMEETIDNLETVNQTIAKHKDLLISKGMKADLPNMLETVLVDIRKKNTQKNKIKQNRQLLTSNNLGSYEVLYKTYITDICKAGKAIYVNQAKEKEYTLTAITKKMRVNRSKKNDKGINGDDTESE